MTDAQDILSGRLAQAKGILSSLLIDEQHTNLAASELNNTLWAIDTLLEQATDAFRDMDGPAKPDAPVMCNGEPIPDLAAIKDTLPIGYSSRIEAVIRRCPNPESVRQYLRENGIYQSQLMRRIKDTLH